MDLSSPTLTTNSDITPVFGDNVQDLLNAGALHVNPSAIITVNSIADAVDDFNSGVTTLRDAINQANADDGFDLIVFERSLFSNQQTITLNLGELDITHNTSIIAPRDELTGEDLLTVSGNNAMRVFEIEFGATVSLDGLIVANGFVNENSGAGSGAGIRNSGTLILDNSIVRNDSGINNGFFNISNNGGGIYNSGTLEVSNSTITGNRTRIGGGIYNSGTLEVSNSTISGNFGSDGGGGGIYNSGTLEVRNSTISGNFGSGGGGGISNSVGGTMNVSNSTISNNLIYGSGTGCGIYNSVGGIAAVSNSTISRNNSVNDESTAGGGIGNSGTMDVSNSIINGNTGIGSGGGIYNSVGGTMNVSNSTVSGGYALSGGGISNSGTMNVSNSNIRNNRSNSGGGIYNSSRGTLEVSNSNISANSATNYGGGISNTGTVVLVFSTLTLNQAYSYGGGVYQGNTSYDSFGPGSTSVRNTIIASNLVNAKGINPDVSGTFTSNGYNLIGDSTGSTGFDATGDIVGTSENPIDPRLAPLDFNGGSTQTIALLPDSPAIDAGDPTVLDTDPTTDQRGFPRISGARADIGAFEAQV